MLQALIGAPCCRQCDDIAAVTGGLRAEFQHDRGFSPFNRNQAVPLARPGARAGGRASV